jgi:predicted glutamine amidotransferase
MHNGVIGGFARVRRALVMAVDPSLFPLIQGTTDSEVFCYLLLTFGLETDPEGAFRRAVALVLAEMQAASVAPTLYYTIGVHPLDALGVKVVDADQACLIVSEPLDEVADSWHEVPPAHILVAGTDGCAVVPLAPQA